VFGLGITATIGMAGRIEFSPAKAQRRKEKL